MKILMLLEREFPPDDRVEKEALSLIEAGHTLILACYTLKDRNTCENYKSIKLHRKPISKMMYKLSAVALVLPFYFIFWKEFIKAIYKIEKFDAIHVHDLPLTKVAFKFCKKYGLKLVCDQHEYYSSWIVQTAHYNTAIGKIIKKLGNWEKYEKKYLEKADLVLTVTEPLRKIYIEEVGIPGNKIKTLPNSPLLSVFNSENILPDIIKKYSNNFVLFYAGGIDILRGIDICIDAIPFLVNHIKNLKVVLAGEIRKNCDPVDHAKLLGVEKYVEYIHWINIEELPSYIAASNICFFVPRATRAEIHNTIATKIYQYVIMKKPVIVGEAKMMKDFIVGNGFGLAIKDGDHKDFAEKVLQVYNNPQFISTENYKNLYEKIDSWEKTIQTLINAYHEFSIN